MKALIMSINTTLSTSKISLISRHIIEVIEFLLQSNQGNSDSDFKKTTPDSFNLLLISDPYIVDNLLTQIQKLLETHTDAKVQITTISPDEFLLLPFNERYELGCYIDQKSVLNSNSPLDSTSSSNTKIKPEPTSLKDIKNIAIRLRDLFAQQSLIFIPTRVTDLGLNGFGYNSVQLFLEAPDTPRIICWQFNLYDYKQRPDWLNAKYWANPENFDKYRW